MFSNTPNYTKLKTNLRLALNRLKLLEKKKAELAQKARKEIADYLSTGKIERARIRVEHIIREDYLVEAMEIIEVYCDLLLARFGLVTQMKELDAGISEAVSSIVWVCPRMQSDITELKIISDIFIQKYGPQFTEQARSATGNHNVSEKLMHKLQLQAPPKLLVEKYLIEIARNYQIAYEPDPQIMKEDQMSESHLIDLSDRNNLSGSAIAPQVGFIGYPLVPPLPEPPSNKPFNYPPPYGGGGGSTATNAVGTNATMPFAFNIPPNVDSVGRAAHSKEDKDLNINANFIQGEASRSNNNRSPDENFLNAPANIQNSDQRISPPPCYSSINPFNSQKSDKPKPHPRGKVTLPPSGKSNASSYPGIPDLPNVPSDLPDIPNDEPHRNDNDDIDFDDLSRRFEELKKKK